VSCCWRVVVIDAIDCWAVKRHVHVASWSGVSYFSTVYGVPCSACRECVCFQSCPSAFWHRTVHVPMYITITSIAGLSGLALSAPAHLVGIRTAHILFTLTVEQYPALISPRNRDPWLQPRCNRISVIPRIQSTTLLKHQESQVQHLRHF